MPVVRIFRKMQDLLDVDPSAIADGKVPVWRAANGKHLYETPAGGGVDISGKVDKDSVVAAATRIVESRLLAGDAQPALQILGDGKLKWGPGGAGITDTDLFRGSSGVLKTSVHFQAAASITAYQGTVNQVQLGNPAAGISFGNAFDTNLYRLAAGILKTDGQFRTTNEILGPIGPSSESGLRLGGDTNLYRVLAGQLATDGFFYAQVSTGLAALGARRIGDSGWRFYIGSDGAMNWGLAAGTYDTNLYRSAAATLKTDGSIHAVANLAAQAGLAGQVLVGNFGLGAGIALGSASDTNLYRSAAGTLKTDGSLQSASLITQSGTANQINIWSDGKIYFGSASDTNLYRLAAGTLATDGRFACQFVSLATLKSLDVGAVDSGGAGFRMVRVPN